MKISELAERGRTQHPTLPPTKHGDRCGYFVLKDKLRVIASDATDWPYGGVAWEHVSVSTALRCPSWEEMCFVKRHFFDAEELVVQFHPPASRYINAHPFCLHLWKPISFDILLPPGECLAPTGGAA